MKILDFQELGKIESRVAESVNTVYFPLAIRGMPAYYTRQSERSCS